MARSLLVRFDLEQGNCPIDAIRPRVAKRRVRTLLLARPAAFLFF
jgi:hypothetical protein